MKAISSLLALSAIASANPDNSSTNWAVLIAGSNSYYNYRHQADISHSYQILTKLGGFPPSNVITMIYNDIVNNSQNPFPGQLFNEPGGVDVYGDIVVDYAGDQVTAKNFLNVIQGIREGDTKDNKVLESNKNDNVFIYYSDHGATGLVAMPTGEPLYATDLMKALNYMYTNGMYSQLVFYLEACESGSMFDGILPNDTHIFATSAATPDQPSYAYYYNETLQTYMADEYSIRWMQDSTNNWDAYESLITQYTDVAGVVEESQPQKYGDQSFDGEPIEDFEAFDNRKGKKALNMLHNSIRNLKNKQSSFTPKRFNKEWIPSSESVSSRDVKLVTLQHRYLSAKGLNNKLSAAQLVQNEIDYRLEIDLLFNSIINYVLDYSNYAFDEDFNNIENTEEYIDAIIYGHLRPSNWQCIKYTYASYENICEERFTDYSLKYVNSLVNLCQIFDDKILIKEAFNALC